MSYWCYNYKEHEKKKGGYAGPRRVRPLYVRDYEKGGSFKASGYGICPVCGVVKIDLGGKL